MKSLYAVTISSFALLAAVASSQVGPTPYLQASDSPWASLLGNGMFYLEDFQDGSLNTPGVSASTGSVIGPGGLTDSVDADDGLINGNGNGGRSFFTGSGLTGIRFTFTSGAYGALPTHTGLVWTDGHASGSVRFEAFDAAGVSLGVLTGDHADGNYAGGTAEDRFYGWVHSGGIKSILITNPGPGGGLEIDHLQYGAVPEPGTMAAIGVGVAAVLARRRKK
jgi:hypothetical protein